MMVLRWGKGVGLAVDEVESLACSGMGSSVFVDVGVAENVADGVQVALGEGVDVLALVGEFVSVGETVKVEVGVGVLVFVGVGVLVKDASDVHVGLFPGSSFAGAAFSGATPPKILRIKTIPSPINVKNLLEK